MKLKQKNNTERLKSLKIYSDFDPQKEYDKRYALDLTELKEMSSHIDFQSHSKFHPVLTKCSDTECKSEIQGSRSTLQEFLKKDIRHFCYPNGDYSEREISFVKECGYSSARTIDVGWVTPKSNPLV